jgi:hypothetical protein
MQVSRLDILGTVWRIGAFRPVWRFKIYLYLKRWCGVSRSTYILKGLRSTVVTAEKRPLALPVNVDVDSLQKGVCCVVLWPLSYNRAMVDGGRHESTGMWRGHAFPSREEEKGVNTTSCISCVVMEFDCSTR